VPSSGIVLSACRTDPHPVYTRIGPGKTTFLFGRKTRKTTSPCLRL